jgi:hypothetical protein
MSKAAELANLIGNINAGGGGVNRNLIINGAMQVAQRSTSETNPGGGYNVIDRFRISQNGGGLGNFTEAQVADAPSGSGLTNSLKFTKSGSTSIASGTTAFFQQNIEGQNLQHLKYGTSSALPVTASFYVKSSLTGTFGINLEQNGNSRHNVQTYTISSANTWELKSVTFVGDTASALANDNTNELSLRFVMGAGSNFQTSSTNTWAAGDKHTTSSQVQLVETDGATFFLTGVQLEVGQNPTEFEHEPFERTLAKCQRYFQEIFMFHDAGSQYIRETIPFKVEMRASPTGTVFAQTNSGGGTNTSGKIYQGSGENTASVLQENKTSARLDVTAGGFTANQDVYGRVTLASEL